MAYYSFEKGKYGGPTGTIFPFFRELNGLLPIDQDYKDYVPAGFLKCRGQILQADQFPSLAELLGVGESCIYKKEGTVLQERNDNGTGGTFQLPDLGSKYIATSANPGQYSNTTTVDPVTNASIQRAGIEVNLESAGDSVEFTYSGNFRSPGATLAFTGRWNLVSPPSKTPSTTLSISNFSAHAHNATYTIASQTNLNSQAIARAAYIYEPLRPCNRRSASKRCTSQSNYGVSLEQVDLGETGNDRGHNHPLSNPAVSETKSGNIPPVLLSASPIVTTVNVRTRSLSKIDDIAPKFIICEYLIKF